MIQVPLHLLPVPLDGLLANLFDDRHRGHSARGHYDLIWCGSLFTHIHADQWRALLQLFSAHLSDSGLLTRSSSASPTGENNQVLADGQLEVEGVGLRHDAKPRSDLRALRCRVLAEDGERA